MTNAIDAYHKELPRLNVDGNLVDINFFGDTLGSSRAKGGFWVVYSYM